MQVINLAQIQGKGGADATSCGRNVMCHFVSSLSVIYHKRIDRVLPAEKWMYELCDINTDEQIHLNEHCPF